MGAVLEDLYDRNLGLRGPMPMSDALGVSFNSSLAILGVLAVKRNPTYTAELSSFLVAQLRALLDTAMEILNGLDKGNTTIMRCRNIFTRLITAYDDVDGRCEHRV
ncbi:hypothetical protein B0T25DRAFT_567403 [Lasiosphaeria hispida]|uniref:Uncharacterized protein n=1 Tax=Lasiosphaeria hispida TaxID=260671 RepID=A0AAJ0MGY2_9PEZI|nr:hypothetical protein B0T25DRAFT_567403 [Lasiosphaeria hispida]